MTTSGKTEIPKISEPISIATFCPHCGKWIVFRVIPKMEGFEWHLERGDDGAGA